jgi:glycolate oxidase iron-sulfur subunit
MRDPAAYDELIQKCSHCAFCQATCPVYREDLLETHVARARISLIRHALILHDLPVSPRLREVVDRCLLCTNCVQTCPAKLPVDEIVVAARHQLGLGLRGRVKAMFLNQFMRRRGFSGPLARAAALLAQKTVAPDFPVPARHRGAGALTRATARATARASASAKPRARVAYFIGCATNSIDPQTAADVISVFTANGIEVIVPDGMVCCGIPALGIGAPDLAADLARINIAALTREPVDAVITDCTTCGMVLKNKLTKLLPPDDPLQLQAAVLSTKVWEATDFLDHLGLEGGQSCPPIPPCTYHVPCHRGWSPTLNDAPRRLLARIGAELIEQNEPERCCGAGGAFHLEHRALSSAIRRPKIDDINRTGAGIVITQCPACRSYLASALPDKEVLHPLSLLARGYNRTKE